VEGSCGVGFDQRWHDWIEERSNDHDYKLRGNGTKGLMERVATIENYIATQVEREKEKRKDRLQYKVAGYAGALALAGLLIMTILDHTVLKPPPPTVPVVVQQTTTTDTTSTTTKIPVTK
jgi:hypothetical protein